MNDRLINFYMGVARHCAGMSRAIRLQVGAVVVKDDNIISFSWNGTPAGWDNNCEEKIYMDQDAGGWLDPEEIEQRWPHVEYCGEFQDQTVRYALKTRPEVLHAESNAISKLARSANSGQDADIFITHAPCLDCAKLIYQSGIRRVWFGAAYRDNAGVEFLQRSGIEITQYDNTSI